MLSINEYVKEFAEKGAVDDILVEEDDVAIVSVNSVDSKNENADAAVDNDYKDSSNKNNNGKKAQEVAPGQQINKIIKRRMSKWKRD